MPQDVERVSPSFGTIALWRDVVRRNPPIRTIEFTLATALTWLPAILVTAGFFTSNSQVRKNRPDLWRDRSPYDGCDLGWADIEIIPA